MKIQIQNTSGLFVQLVVKTVITDVALRAMRQELDHPSRWPANHGIHQQLAHLVPLMEALPIVPRYTAYLSAMEQQAPEFKLAYHIPEQLNGGVGTLNVRYWVAPNGSKGASSRHDFEVNSLDPEDLGWPAAERLAPHEAALGELLQAFGCTSAAYDKRVSGAKGLAKKAKDWTIVAQDDQKLFARTETFAIYSITSKGYLNDKGSYVPVGGARTFETALQASRTAQARKLSDVAIVKMQTQVVAIDPIIEVGTNLGELGAALAQLEGEVLHETLRRAKEEDLLAQLEVLRAAGQVEDLNPVAAPRPRRRM